jgi:hypothetical protein
LDRLRRTVIGLYDTDDACDKYTAAIEYYDKVLAMGIDPRALTSKGLALDNLDNHIGD